MNNFKVFAILFLLFFTYNIAAQHSKENHYAENFFDLSKLKGLHVEYVLEHHFIETNIKEAFYSELSKFGASNNYNVDHLTRYYLTNFNVYSTHFKHHIFDAYPTKIASYDLSLKEEDLLFNRLELTQYIKSIIPIILADYHHEGYSKNTFSVDDIATSYRDILKKKRNDKGAGEECNNPDFETCDFTGWEMYTGSVNSNPYEMINTVTTDKWCSENTGICYNDTASGGSCGCTTGDANCAGQNDCIAAFVNPITGACTCTDCPCGLVHPYDPSHYTVNPGVDAHTNVIQEVNPNGGGCAAVIGDYRGTGSRAASIVQTFRVSTNSANFSYSYAAVLEDPSGHTLGEKPFFKVNMYDANGDDIICGLYSATAGDGQAGWINAGSYVYKDWTTVFVPLQGYIGQDVTIEFIVGDCSQGGHFGYAYIDMTCSPLELLIGSAAPCGPTTISAPPGADSYLWSPTGETTQAITPTTSGTYSVTITPVSGSGCSVTLDTTVTIEPKSVTAGFTSASGCVGVPVTFTDQSTTTGTTIDTWAWDFGDGNTSTQQHPSHTYASVGSFNVTLTVTSFDGCTDNITLPITINPCIGPQITLVGDTICEGETGTLTAIGTDGTLNYTFDWTGGGITGNSDNGTTDPTTVTQTDNPATTTTYTVLITDNNGDTATATADIVVNPLPNVSADSDASICIGESVNITGSGANTYVWDNGLPAIAGPHSVSPGVTTTYTVTGTDVNGCVNDSSVTITVNPLPTITTADEAVCWEDSVQICAAGGATYTWAAFDGGLFDAGNTGACVYVEGDLSAPGADYTRQYEVTGTDVNGCVGIDTATVTYEAICGPSVMATGDTICINEPSASLTTVITNTTGVVTYAWTPITNLDDPTSPNPVFTPTVDGTFTYTVTITDDLGTDTDSTIIIVHPLPLVIGSLDTAICIGASANVTASGAISYVWDNGLPTTAGPHNVSPGVTTTYTVTGTDVNGCVNDSTVTITVNPLPIITTADNSVCKDNPITICAAAGVTYSWISLDGGLINGSSTTTCIDVETDNPTATADEERRYEVTGSDANGCVNTAISTVTFNYICGLTIRATGDTICEGDVAQLTSDTSFVTGAVTYSWTPTAGLSDPTAANPTVTGLTTTTTYQVIATDALASDTATATVMVNPLPAANDQTPAAMCEDTQGSGTVAGIDLTANEAAINGGLVTYDWFGALPPASPIATPNNVTVSDAQVFYVLVTDNVTGCVDTAMVTYTVNPLPVPDAGMDQAICIGDNATVTATSTGANPITYTWDQNPPGTGAGPHTLSPTATTTYTVTATDNNGCVNTDTMTITVNPLPVPDAGIDQTICIGDNATITATSTGANPIGYTWDNGLPATSGPHNVSPAAATTYTVTATDNNGCVNTDVVTVTVNPLPTPNAGVDQTICLNTSTTITAISGGTGPFNFVWDNGLPATNGPHTVSPAVGTTTYIVTVTDANGCVNSDSVDITVNPIPTIVASNDTTICAGESATLFASGGSTYVWRNLTTGVDFSTSANPTVQPTDANTCYQVTGTDAARCSSTDLVCVTVEQPPVTNFTVAPVCNGGTSSFNNTTTGGATYNWNFGDGNTSNVFSPQHVYNGEGKYYVQLTATSAAGCVSTYADTAIVKYVPVMNFDGINLTGCPPVTSTFTNRSDSLDPNFTYFWDFGDGTSSNTSDTTVSHTYSEVGSYTVRLTITTNGCSDMRERINYVIIHPVPEAHFTAEPSIVDIYEPTINFTDLSIGADQWSWDFGDLNGSNDQHPTHQYTDTGTFVVWLWVENQFGCKDSATKPVRVRDIYTFFAPNSFTPDGDGVNDVFLPQGHAIDMDEYTLYIFDRWGELIFETNDYYEGWNGIYQGRPVQIDTYVWKVDLKDIFGEHHKYIGKVSVLR